jgi:hypothetical protein
MSCDWLVEVAVDNPEPDSPADLYEVVECGAELTDDGYGSWHCAAGHSHVSHEDPRRGEWEAQEAARERAEETGWRF